MRHFLVSPPAHRYLAMATQADVRRLALLLPGTEEESGRFAFAVPVEGKPKGYA
jgi:hypothetical protein